MGLFAERKQPLINTVAGKHLAGPGLCCQCIKMLGGTRSSSAAVYGQVCVAGVRE